MDVSVILVNYNTCKLTIEAINSVYKFTNKIKFEIIVIDNNSSDNSIEEINNKFSNVIIKKNKKNIGFGRANNEGMKIANGKYFFLLNTDTFLLNNAIEIFYNFMENPLNNNVAVVGGTLYFPNGDMNVSFGSFPNFQAFVKGTFWRHFYNRSFYENYVYKDVIKHDKIPFMVDYVSGANFFIRSEIIKKVGAFKNCFFMYFEETELTFRIKRKLLNAQVYVIPKAKIVHIGQGSNLNNVNGLKFKLQYLKSKSLYFKFQNGNIACAMVYIRGLIKIFFKH